MASAASPTYILVRAKTHEAETVIYTGEVLCAAFRRYKLNIWDVGGQRTIRSFWRNYFEETDGVVWVVDASDGARLSVCREELHKLMKEERLAGASLLVLANKQDIRSAASARDICEAYTNF